MADFSICNDILVNFDSHCKNSNGNEVYKDYAKWVKVICLKTGMEIAVADGDKAVWEKIVSIKQHPEQHVYDLAIEGTHNFIANNIIAHNTCIHDNSAGKTDFSAFATLLNFKLINTLGGKTK